jgi:hypothetical protein
MPGHWTPADDEIVLSVSPAEATRRLGRTLHAVYGRRRKLGAAGRKRPWTAAEDRLVRRLPPDLAAAYLKRTLRSVEVRRSRLGLTGRAAAGL